MIALGSEVTDTATGLLRMSSLTSPASEEEECDHDWEFVDESFSHEFGTEVLVFRQCRRCDEIDNNVSDPDDDGLVL